VALLPVVADSQFIDLQQLEVLFLFHPLLEQFKYYLLVVVVVGGMAMALVEAEVVAE